jgi:hypothetical protein
MRGDADSAGMGFARWSSFSFDFENSIARFAWIVNTSAI